MDITFTVVTYPEMNSTKLFVVEQQKFNNTLAF